VIERREGDGENLLERDCLLSSSLSKAAFRVASTRRELPRDGNLKDERKHVGDGLNRRGTRRNGFLAEEFREINARTRRGACARIPRR